MHSPDFAQAYQPNRPPFMPSALILTLNLLKEATEAEFALILYLFRDTMELQFDSTQSKDRQTESK